MFNRLAQMSVIVVGLFLVNPTLLYADGCRVIGRSVSYPTFNHHATVTYPSYYQPTTILPLTVQTFYQVAPEIAQAQVNKITAKEAAKEALDQFKAELRAEVEKQNTTKQSPSPSEKIGTGKAPEQPNTDPLAGIPLRGISAQGDSPDVQSIFSNRCLKCHGEGAKLDFSSLPAISQDMRERIVSSTHREEGVQPMPPKDKLTAAENQMIRRWAYGVQAKAN